MKLLRWISTLVNGADLHERLGEEETALLQSFREGDGWTVQSWKEPGTDYPSIKANHRTSGLWVLSSHVPGGGPTRAQYAGFYFPQGFAVRWHAVAEKRLGEVEEKETTRNREAVHNQIRKALNLK